MRYALLWLLAISPGLYADQRACTVDLPVYDALGNRLDFKVTGVTPQDRPDFNLLAVRPKAVESLGDRLSLEDRTLLRRVIIVTLENPAGKKIMQRVFLMQCSQRVSVRFGASETYGDLSFQILRGRLFGCRFVGDWWIRLTPMFGTTSPPTAEGFVDSDGSFSLSGSMNGERHLVIVGKDRQPVKVVGVDLITGKANDIGLLDLTGACPK